MKIEMIKNTYNEQGVLVKEELLSKTDTLNISEGYDVFDETGCTVEKQIIYDTENKTIVKDLKLNTEQEFIYDNDKILKSNIKKYGDGIVSTINFNGDDIVYNKIENADGVITKSGKSFYNENGDKTGYIQIAGDILNEEPTAENIQYKETVQPDETLNVKVNHSQIGGTDAFITVNKKIELGNGNSISLLQDYKNNKFSSATLNLNNHSYEITINDNGSIMVDSIKNKNGNNVYYALPTYKIENTYENEEQLSTVTKKLHYNNTGFNSDSRIFAYDIIDEEEIYRVDYSYEKNSNNQKLKTVLLKLDETEIKKCENIFK